MAVQYQWPITNRWYVDCWGHGGVRIASFSCKVLMAAIAFLRNLTFGKCDSRAIGQNVCLMVAFDGVPVSRVSCACMWVSSDRRIAGLQDCGPKMRPGVGGARMPCAGVEFVPADIGTVLVGDAAPSPHYCPCGEYRCGVCRGCRTFRTCPASWSQACSQHSRVMGLSGQVPLKSISCGFRVRWA